MRHSSKYITLRFATGFFVLLFAALTCCTKVDDSLGLNLVPGNQLMSVHIDTFGREQLQQVKTYTVPVDSVATSMLGYTVIGSYHSEEFGTTRAVAMLQMMPVTENHIKEGGYGFGEENRPDSVKLSLKPTYLTGDYDTEQVFMVYPMNTALPADSTYYKSIAYESLMEEDAIFSFSLSGKPDTTLLVSADITERGWEYMKELLSDETYYYENRNKFHDKFKGLIIEPSDDSPSDAAIYSLNLTTANFYLYFTDMAKANDPNRDTLFVPLYMRDDEREMRNVSVTSLRTDYSDTPVEAALALSEDMIPQQITYVHGFGGVTTRLEFPDEFYDAILQKRGNGQTLFLNQAMIFTDILDDSWEVMDISHARLGSYYNYNVLKGIPDYLMADQINSSATSSYGGHLNRTHGYYAMDITTFLHYALGEYEKKKNGESYLEE